MKNKPNEPAFPCPSEEASAGVTVRGYFAAKALQGLLASGAHALTPETPTGTVIPPDRFAEVALSVADSLVARLARETHPLPGDDSGGDGGYDGLHLEFSREANRSPEKCLELVARAIMKVHKAFGAPGDFGYETKEGYALQCLYESTHLIHLVRQKLQRPHDPRTDGPHQAAGPHHKEQS